MSFKSSQLSEKLEDVANWYVSNIQHLSSYPHVLLIELLTIPMLCWLSLWSKDANGTVVYPLNKKLFQGIKFL